VDAINLVHYLALRHGDVRHLQRWLGARGLSSLGRCEAHVLATVESVRTALDGTEPQPGPTAESFEAGRSALDRNTDALFGARPPGRVPRIMVTLPSEAADDFALVRRLVSKGMDVARINGAHDGPSTWERMAVNVRRASSDVGRPCRVSMDCTLPGAFDAARVGQRVILDDGKLTGLIDGVADGELRVRIVSASAKGSRLRAEKGINLPDTDLAAGAVSDADMPLLEVAAVHADMLAVSFLRHERDVDEIHRYLKTAHAEHLGLVLKIETTAAYARLPEILLHAMRSPLVGVMIARGDLAVEAGYDRLAELQEEILWICEAAHLPVIWATEVLDQLARTGRPSRAEVTDAAMGQRAECVMLNKGPHVDAAIVFLDDILRRMSRHQRKNTPLLQPLDSWNKTDMQP